MRIKLIVLVFILMLGGLQAQVNGELQHVDGKMVLHVWGTHYQRGYAQGYLFSNRVLSMMHDYFYVSVCGNSSTAYNYLLNYYNARFTVADKYVSEATGIMDGVAAAGNSLYHSGLQRDLNTTDLLMINAIVDLSPVRGDYFGRDEYELGCSSISSWGSSTLNDPVLQGALIHTRLLDWTIHNSLIANHALIVHHPSEAGEQKWMSFSYPGLIGALSGVTEVHSAAFLNMGNSHGGSNFMGMRHVLLTLRDALEMADYNDDGFHDIDDMHDALSGNRFRAGTIIHAMWDQSSGSDPTVFEVNNYGVWTRTQYEMSGLPQDHLAATNHFRVMIEPAACYRYTNLINSLTADSLMTIGRQWNMLSAAAGVPFNIMGIQFIPSLGQVSWSGSTAASPAHLINPIQLGTPELFGYTPSSATDPLIPALSPLRLYPNPISRGETLKLQSGSAIRKVAIYNQRGQLLFSRDNVPEDLSLHLDEVLSRSGIYFVKASYRDGRENTAKLLWMR